MKKIIIAVILLMAATAQAKDPVYKCSSLANFARMAVRAHYSDQSDEKMEMAVTATTPYFGSWERDLVLEITEYVKGLPLDATPEEQGLQIYAVPLAVEVKCLAKYDVRGMRLKF